MKLFIDIVGWVGALGILLAYGLLTTRRIAAGSRAYQWLNALGSIGLIANGAWNGAYPSVFLNGVWLVITFYAVAEARRTT
ncbi:MAG: hypothetical protein JSR73_05995 [Proteobacteria bacterium]|nr:hypothetical protein [Pseudomonadota bacterium]